MLFLTETVAEVEAAAAARLYSRTSLTTWATILYSWLHYYTARGPTAALSAPRNKPGKAAGICAQLSQGLSHVAEGRAGGLEASASRATLEMSERYCLL